MSILAKLESWVAAPASVADFADNEMVAVAAPAVSSVTHPSASTYRAQAVARSVALQIPAMRKARHALLTPATFRLAAYDASGQRLADNDPRSSWLAQPEANRTSFRTLASLLDDGLWHDKAVVRQERNIAGTTAYVERIHPQRWNAIYAPNDPETVEAWVVDGTLYSDAELAARGYVVFDFAGLGGLRQLGYPLLALYADLQAAAGKYARAPHPHAILKNHGPDLTKQEVADLLDEWEWARENRGVGYMNDVVEYQTQGWNARELQLTEAREHAALEVARLVGLPAFALDAKSGDSMTYGNVVERRKDLVEALRPWTTVITQTMSLDNRLAKVSRGTLLPRGVRADLDASDYLRADPLDRMNVWEKGLTLGVLDLDDVTAQEPLSRKVI